MLLHGNLLVLHLLLLDKKLINSFLNRIHVLNNSLHIAGAVRRVHRASVAGIAEAAVAVDGVAALAEALVAIERKKTFELVHDLTTSWLHNIRILTVLT